MTMIDKLITRIHTIINSHYKTRCGPSLERFLYYLSKIYEIAVLSRNTLFKLKILKSRSLPCFVISIGNIVAGGTGKTPMTIYIANYLVSLGYKVAIVTRGYKGKFEHKGGIVCDGNKILCTPIEAGDEPYMMAKLLKLPLIAGKNRFKAGMIALKKFSPDIIILDDAFQHIALKRDLNLLLLDARNPFGNNYLLPRGTLREPLSSIGRSDAVIYTHSSSNSSQSIHIDNNNIIPGKMPLFTSDHIPYINKIVPENYFSLPETKSKENISSYIQGKEVLLFSGIANNLNVETSCEKMGFIINRHIKFSDHYQYTKKDIDKIKEIFNQTKIDFIVTTLKDYTKTSDFFSAEYPVIVLDVNIHFNGHNRQNFELFLKNRLKQQSLSCDGGIIWKK